MKRMTILMATLLAFVVSGCSVDRDKPYSSYHINNESEEVFLVYVESTPEYSHRLGDSEIPMGTRIYPLMDNIWISHSPRIGENVCTDENFTFTFVFSRSGVKHTFSGEMIEHDFRDANSWQKVIAEDANGTGYDKYTYTFTQEDYERIMALYE